MCVHITVVGLRYTARNSSDNSPLILRTVIIAQRCLLERRWSGRENLFGKYEVQWQIAREGLRPSRWPLLVPCHTCDFVARLWRATPTRDKVAACDYEVARCDFVARQSRASKSRDKIARVTWQLLLRSSYYGLAVKSIKNTLKLAF